MRRLFGVAKEKPPAPTLDDASKSMGVRGDTVDERIKKLDGELIKLRDQMRKLPPGSAQDAVKGRALRALKQKKLYEGQREQLFTQQFNLEQVSFATQSVKDSALQLQAMKAASVELRTALGRPGMGLAAIDKMQDEMADLMATHGEMQEMLGRSYGVPDDVDEEALLGELDSLEAELATESAAAEAAPGTAAERPSYLAPMRETPAAATLPELPGLPARPAAPLPTPLLAGGGGGGGYPTGAYPTAGGMGGYGAAGTPAGRAAGRPGGGGGGGGMAAPPVAVPVPAGFDESGNQQRY